ncbi:hypothetical protein KTD23_30600, partial [Burkholderia multivorans]|nr:hypothetical protein [Burkholderia multivorans]
LTAMLLHQSNGTLTDFRRKFVVLAHGSIFSKVGASSKPGAIHLEERIGIRLLERTSRVVTPTVAGELLYQHCKEVYKASLVARQTIITLTSAE